MTLTCNLEKTSRLLANQPTALLSANQLSPISWELLQHLGTSVIAKRCPFGVAKGEISNAQIQTCDFFHTEYQQEELILPIEYIEIDIEK